MSTNQATNYGLDERPVLRIQDLEETISTKRSQYRALLQASCFCAIFNNYIFNSSAV